MEFDDEGEDRPVRPKRRQPSNYDEDDQDDDRPVRRRRAPYASGGLSAGAYWGISKWVALGVGMVLALIAFGVSAIHAAVLSGLACFLGIAARIFQAEEHRAAKRE
jgi:hypothetical protein